MPFNETKIDFNKYPPWPFSICKQNELMYCGIILESFQAYYNLTKSH